MRMGRKEENEEKQKRRIGGQYNEERKGEEKIKEWKKITEEETREVMRR